MVNTKEHSKGKVANHLVNAIIKVVCSCVTRDLNHMTIYFFHGTHAVSKTQGKWCLIYAALSISQSQATSCIYYYIAFKP